MSYHYDIRTGVKKIKTKLAIAFTTFGLLVGGGTMSLALFGTAHANVPTTLGGWQINAPSTINFSCGGSNYIHTLKTISEDSTGAFTGTGSYNPDPSYTWTTSGNVNGNNVTFSILYTGTAAGSIYNLNGTIASNGSISGTSDSNCQTFTMPAGSATFNFDANSNLNPGQCSVTKDSKEVVDVKYKLINDYDSAVGGNAWANDTINRHLTIWNNGEASYCAIVKDEGTIVTFAGSSPNGTGTVGAGIKGEMNGGYRVAFKGMFLGNGSSYSRHGNLGTFDLACTDAYNCPGGHPTINSYTTGWDGNTLDWWGWQYKTCQNGSWVNSIYANIGDITGTAPGHDTRCHEDNDNHHHDNDASHQDKDNNLIKIEQSGPRD